MWRKLSLRDSGTVTSYDNNSTHLCHMDQAKPSIATHQKQQQKRKRQQLRGMPRPSSSTPCSCLLLPVTLLLRPRQLRLGIVYVFVSASLPAAVAVPVPVSVAALPLAACLCLPPSAAKCDIFARLISDRTCHSSTSRCVFRFLQHIPRQKGFAFVSAWDIAHKTICWSLPPFLNIFFCFFSPPSSFLWLYPALFMALWLLFWPSSSLWLAVNWNVCRYAKCFAPFYGWVYKNANGAYTYSPEFTTYCQLVRLYDSIANEILGLN